MNDYISNVFSQSIITHIIITMIIHDHNEGDDLKEAKMYL